MMTDDIITGKASIKGREDVKNVVCSLNRIKAIRGKYSAEELSGEPPQAMILVMMKVITRFIQLNFMMVL